MNYGIDTIDRKKKREMAKEIEGKMLGRIGKGKGRCREINRETDTHWRDKEKGGVSEYTLSTIVVISGQTTRQRKRVT